MAAAIVLASASVSERILDRANDVSRPVSGNAGIHFEYDHSAKGFAVFSVGLSLVNDLACSEIMVIIEVAPSGDILSGCPA